MPRICQVLSSDILSLPMIFPIQISIDVKRTPRVPSRVVRDYE